MVRSDDMRLRLFVGYVVTSVWAASFLIAIIRPPENTSLYLSAQAVMMVVAGSMFTSSLLGGGKAKDEAPPEPKPTPKPKSATPPKRKPPARKPPGSSP